MEKDTLVKDGSASGGKKTLLKVVIVGRANVGKSTLFNRLVEKNKALVSSVAGTTRDRNIDVVHWQGKSFELIDTGGLDVDKKLGGIIEINIVRQAKTAIKNADLILFLVDVKQGILPTDKDLTRELVKQKLKAKTILIGNKADSPKWRQSTGELYQLGLGEPQMLSAASGSGVGDLLDLITKRLPKGRLITKTDDTQSIKIAIVGKPNVGKSSLMNSILGEERVIVTDIPHTTRESHDTKFQYKGHTFILIDTAGIRKQNKIKLKSLEQKSVDKSISAIKSADIVIIITEVQKRITTQDKKITDAVLEHSRPVVIVANKWDLIPDKDTKTINKYIEYYQTQFPYLWWAPIIFISAKEDQRSKKILDLALEINQAKRIEISNSQLEKFLKIQIKKHVPARGRGLKNPYIYKIEQVKTNPPKFVIYVNDPKILHFSYIRYLQNNIRKKFNITGTPIGIEVEKWKKSEEK
ncbi:MAG TPA: ribosome biogenesis GTPase Der [Patescibacteria group bacterium]|nr:ribosome biogenesis GTPase Der [Patescibacteria group bacterium]